MTTTKIKRKHTIYLLKQNFKEKKWTGYCYVYWGRKRVVGEVYVLLITYRMCMYVIYRIGVLLCWTLCATLIWDNILYLLLKIILFRVQPRQGDLEAKSKIFQLYSFAFWKRDDLHLQIARLYHTYIHQIGLCISVHIPAVLNINFVYTSRNEKIRSFAHSGHWQNWRKKNYEIHSCNSSKEIFFYCIPLQLFALIHKFWGNLLLGRVVVSLLLSYPHTTFVFLVHSILLVNLIQIFLSRVVVLVYISPNEQSYISQLSAILLLMDSWSNKYFSDSLSYLVYAFAVCRIRSTIE